MFRKIQIPVRFSFTRKFSNFSSLKIRKMSNKISSHQIIGAVLNMAYFLAPGSREPHYIFGPSTSFHQTCTDLSLDILAEIPMDPQIASTGDLGSPFMTGKSNPSSSPPGGIMGIGIGAFKLGTEMLRGGNKERSKVELEFHTLAEKVWGKIL